MKAAVLIILVAAVAAAYYLKPAVMCPLSDRLPWCTETIPCGPTDRVAMGVAHRSASIALDEHIARSHRSDEAERVRSEFIACVGDRPDHVRCDDSEGVALARAVSETRAALEQLRTSDSCEPLIRRTTSASATEASP